jgi:predicted acylesterase/phospholipase RssA
MTCAIPILLTPVCIENKCYIDGGMSSNYPLIYCIESGKNQDEILGFKNKYNNDKNYINSESTLLEFILNFLFKAIFSINTDDLQPNIKNEVICCSNLLTLNILSNALSNIEIRKQLFNNGIENAELFLSKLDNSV